MHLELSEPMASLITFVSVFQGEPGEDGDQGSIGDTVSGLVYPLIYTHGGLPMLYVEKHGKAWVRG